MTAVFHRPPFTQHGKVSFFLSFVHKQNCAAYLILAIRHRTRPCLFVQVTSALSEEGRSTTKCCIPARKSGKSENSPEAPSVIVGIEVDDAETIGKPQRDGIGPGFVWTNTFWDYVVCQSTATCFLSFKHWGYFSLKMQGNEEGKKGGGE